MGWVLNNEKIVWIFFEWINFDSIIKNLKSHASNQDNDRIPCSIHLECMTWDLTEYKKYNVSHFNVNQWPMKTATRP